MTPVENGRVSPSRPYRFPVRSLLTAILASIALVSACTAGGAAETTATPWMTEAPGSTAPTPTTATPTTVVPEVATTVSGRPLAPDFTLALGDGGSYTLSEGAKPVYLVFWAEW